MMEPFRIPIDPELKNIIDKLANFVARNGPEFEEMTKGKQRDNPKFSFLFGGEHFPYYKMKVQEEFMNLRSQSHLQNQPFNNMNFQMNANNMPFAPWQQQPQQYNQFNMQPNFQQNIQPQSLLNKNAPYNQSPFPSYTGGNQATNNMERNSDRNNGLDENFGNSSTFDNRGQSFLPNQMDNSSLKPYTLIEPNSLDVTKPVSINKYTNNLSEIILKQIKDSEMNLAKLHRSLTDEQQTQIEMAILNAQDAKLNKLSDESRVDLKELEAKIIPIIESCTKDAISNGKSWILQNINSPKVPEIVARYLLKRVMSVDSTCDARLHLIYLINDLMHHSIRKNVEELKTALENVIVPIFCQAFVKANDEHKEKLTKLVALWEKNEYFKDEILQFIKDAETSLATYKANLVNGYSSLIDPITRAIDERYERAKRSHESFVASCVQQRDKPDEPLTSTTGMEGIREDLGPGRPPSLMSVKLQAAASADQRNTAGRLGPGPGIGASGRRPEYGNTGEPDFNEFLNMNGTGANSVGLGPGLLPGSPASFFMNSGNPMQQQQCWNAPGPVNDQQHQQQLMAMMMMMMANSGAANMGPKNDLMMGPGCMPSNDGSLWTIAPLGVLLCDGPGFYERPKALLPDGPPHPNFETDPQDKSIIPCLPYFELPAGLTVNLVKVDDVDYKPLNPSKLRLPAPEPPTEQLLAAVETFYSQASHEAPRNSEGWEHLGLFEFFKIKSKHRKAYLENLKNREIIDANSSDESGDRDDGQNRRTHHHSSRNALNSRSSRSASPNNQNKPSSPREIKKKRSFKESSPLRDDKSGPRSSRRSRSRSPRNRSNRNGPNNSRRSPATSPTRRRRSRSRSARRNSPPSSRRHNRSSRSPTRSPSPASASKESYNEYPPPLPGWKGAGLGLNEQGTQDPISGGEIRDKNSQFKGVGTGNNPYEEFRKTRCKMLYNR